MEVLHTKGLKKYYGNQENEVKALDGIDISIQQGEFVAIVGKLIDVKDKFPRPGETDFVGSKTFAITRVLHPM